MSVVPRLGRHPFIDIVRQAVQHALLACLASVAITLGLYLLIARSGRSDALVSALRTSSTAIWFAPATLLLTDLSPLALGAALVLVISTTRLLYSQWRVLHPDGALLVPLRQLFDPAPPPNSLKNFAPALIASLGIEAGGVSVLTGDPLLAAVLFSTAAAMLTLAALTAGAYDTHAPSSLPRAILGLALTVILAAGFTVGGLAGHLQRSGGAGWGAGRPSVIESARALIERIIQGSDPVRPKGTVTKIYAPPTGTVEITDKSFPGVILWTESDTPAKLVEPPPNWRPSPLPAVVRDPSVIPFSGEYWMYRPPASQPPKTSYSRWGSPVTLSFLTTDHTAMVMEARQKLPHTMDLSCCGAIDVAISNSDRYPRTIALELILLDGAASQSLGTLGVSALQASILHFTVPQNSAIRQFNELEMVFHRDRVRIDRSARISIERFVLLPR